MSIPSQKTLGDSGHTSDHNKITAWMDPELAITYNADGSVDTVTENGELTTFTYNADGTIDTSTRGAVVRNFSYDNGNLIGVA